jgi:hypothetical protein
MDGKMSNVDPNPMTLEALGYGDSGPAAAERIDDHIAFVRACLDDSLKESFGLLRGVSEAFGSMR